jgi:hypothetical protein
MLISLEYSNIFHPNTWLVKAKIQHTFKSHLFQGLVTFKMMNYTILLYRKNQLQSSQLIV